MRSFKEAVRPILPFVSYFAIFMIWMHWSPSNIMEKEPRIVFLLSGTIFSNISVRRQLPPNFDPFHEPPYFYFSAD